MMYLEVTFRNLNPRDEVKKRAQALYKKVERFLDPAAKGEMVVGVEHGMAIIEAVVTSRGTTYKVKEEDPDLRTAIDRAMHQLENQLRRAKDRRTDRKGQGEEVEGFEPVDEVV
jgi:ribosomal subunit interface protein